MFTRRATAKIVAECPDCGEQIALWNDIEVGELVGCRECGAELQVVRTRPLELDWIYDDAYERAETEAL